VGKALIASITGPGISRSPWPDEKKTDAPFIHHAPVSVATAGLPGGPAGSRHDPLLRLEQRRLAVHEAQKDLLEQVRHISVFQEQVVEEVRQLLSTLSELTMVRRRKGQPVRPCLPGSWKSRRFTPIFRPSTCKVCPSPAPYRNPLAPNWAALILTKLSKPRTSPSGEYGLGRASGKPTIHFGLPGYRPRRGARGGFRLHRPYLS